MRFQRVDPSLFPREGARPRRRRSGAPDAASAAQHTRLVRRFLRGYLGGEVETLRRITTEDVVLRLGAPDGRARTLRGHDALARAAADAAVRAAHGAGLAIAAVYADDARAVTVFRDPPGRREPAPRVGLWVFRDGRIAALHVYAAPPEAEERPG